MYENELHSKHSHGGKRAKIDIDETICTYEFADNRRYEDARPDFHSIARINKLYNDGWTIVYSSSRGSSQPGNKDRLKYIWNLTAYQLEKWGCKYHLLEIAQPLYDLVIDDKAKRIEEL